MHYKHNGACTRCRVLLTSFTTLLVPKRLLPNLFLPLQLRIPAVCNTLYQPPWRLHQTRRPSITAALFWAVALPKNPHTLHQYHLSFYGPIRLFLLTTNHSAWRHHHTHSNSTFTTIHSSTWRTANNMPLPLQLHIAQQNIPNSTAAPTHHVSISKNILFFKIFKINFFKIFLGPFPGP